MLIKDWNTYCVLLIQWGKERKILNVKKKLVEKTNEWENHKKNKKEQNKQAEIGIFINK